MIVISTVAAIILALLVPHGWTAPDLDDSATFSSGTYAGDAISLPDGGSFVGLTSMESDWEVHVADTTATLTWGPGVRVGSQSQENVKAAQVCTLQVDIVKKAGTNVTSKSKVTCSLHSSKFMEARFQRRNAVAIWVNYSSGSTTGTVTTNPFNAVWTYPCMGTSGPWMYRLMARSWDSLAGYSAWYGGPVGPQLHCGT